MVHTPHRSPGKRVSRKSKLVVCLALFVAGALQITAQQPGESLHRGFLNPSPDARPIMRWWWFGPAVVKPELKKELETMQQAGIGGVEIQPVYPLTLDDPAKGLVNFKYLSPEFLDDVHFVDATAHQLGLRVDLTLGSGWPYGGPTTTLALASGRLKVVGEAVTSTHVAPPALAEGDSFVAAFVVNGTERSFDPATAHRFDPVVGVVPVGSGRRTALFFIASHTRQMVKRASYGAEGYVLDHFSRAAIDEHLRDVATPLLNAFGNQPPYSVFSDSLEVYGADWTTNLPAEFKSLRGYDLIPHLPELLAGGTPEAEAVRHDWGQTLSDLIRENYLVPVTQFAQAHHTRFRSQTYGTPAVTLADESVPNLPEGEGPQWNTFSFARWATSASHLYGRDVTSAETWTWLHSPVFRATPLDMKAEADRMFLIGINQFVGHGYPYSPPAAGEPGWAFYAAAVFNSHNPWFPVMPDVMHYMQRVSWLLRQGKPANDVAILLPEDDAQAAFSLGRVSVTDEMRRMITPELMEAILNAGYNVDYVDAATINKLGAIPNPILIIPPTDRIPLATYQAIASYAAKSGKVIAIGKAPSLAPGLLQQKETAGVEALSATLFQNAGHKGTLIDSTDQLAEALHHALPADIDLAGQAQGVGFIHRKLANSDIYFVANTSNAPVLATIHFRADRKYIASWNPDSGHSLWETNYNSAEQIPLNLAPYESRIFVIEDHAEGPLQPHKFSSIAENAASVQKLQDLSNAWSIRFKGAATSDTLTNLESWTSLPGKQFYSGEADYTRDFTFDHAPVDGKRVFVDFGKGTPMTDTRRRAGNGTHALLDPPIREAAIILINGRRAGSLWHPPYRIDVTSYLHQGKNHIEVRVFNTAINLLAGQPPHDYTALWAKYGKRFDPQDMDNLKPIPSGLLGPIQLEEQ